MGYIIFANYFSISIASIIIIPINQIIRMLDAWTPEWIWPTDLNFFEVSSRLLCFPAHFVCYITILSYKSHSHVIKQAKISSMVYLLYVLLVGLKHQLLNKLALSHLLHKHINRQVKPRPTKWRWNKINFNHFQRRRRRHCRRRLLRWFSQKKNFYVALNLF